MEEKEQPVKTPAALRKPVAADKFKKHYTKYIEQPGDRAFFASCFIQTEDIYRIRTDLTKEEVKKLKVLFKAIKANRKGAVRIVPLFFGASVTAALVIFFTVFANPLLGRALEKGLEAVFEAKCNVSRFRLSLIRFRISIGSVTVANRDSPMTNLFQMGKTVISLKPEAVLRGKIYIEEVRADTLRFGTPRTVSGALPAKPPKSKKKNDAGDTPPLVDLKNFDAMALLNREYDKLNTPKLYDQAVSAYNETLAKWQGQAGLVKTRTEELRSAAQPLIGLNANNIKDIETVTRTIQEINTMVSTVQTAAEDATKIVTGIEDDINMARNLEQGARNAVTGDLNRLKSYIDLNSGTAFAALEPSIREVLSDSAEQYVDYGLRALEAFEKIKAQNEARPKTEKAKKEKKAAFKGRDVIFPVRMYPKFFLGVLASDFTLDTWNWAFDLRDVSSNPDLTGKPVTLKLGLTEDGGSLQRQVGFKGSADFRTRPEERFSAVVDGKGFPVSMGDKLAKVGIGGFNGSTAFSVNMSGYSGGGASGGGEVHITRAEIVDPVGTVAEAVGTAVQKAGSIDLGIQYTHWVDRADEFKIDTNIAKLIQDALESIVRAYAKKAMDEIERLLRERINQYIDGRFDSREEIDTLFKAVRSEKADIDQLKNTLDNKKTEFEQKLKAAADQALQQAKDEAKQQGQQALQDLMQGQQPTVQTPNLPGGLRLPGR